MNGFPRTDCFIGGEWRATAEALPVADPSTGEDFGSIARGGPAEIDAAVAAARIGGGWRLGEDAGGRARAHPRADRPSGGGARRGPRPP